MNQTNMDDTSVSLLERIAAQNLDEDWQRLLSIYRPFIDAQVRKYPQLATEVDDIVQNICMVLMRELPQFQRQRTGSFRRWFRQVTVNQLRAELRKHRARPLPSSILAELDFALDQLLDPASEASQRWNEEHDQEVLRRVIEIVRGETNPVHWQAFQLHVLEGRPAAEVAAAIGINLNVVQLAKSRIKKRMQSEVQGLLDES